VVFIRSVYTHIGGLLCAYGEVLITEAWVAMFQRRAKEKGTGSGSSSAGSSSVAKPTAAASTAAATTIILSPPQQASVNKGVGHDTVGVECSILYGGIVSFGPLNN